MHCIREVITHIKNNKGTSFITLSTITISMTILGAFLILFFNLKNLAKGLGEDVSLIIYLEDTISQKALETLTSAISVFDETNKLHYISKAAALEQFRKDLGDDQIILEGLTENPLPASLKVIIKPEYSTIERMQKIVDSIKPFKGIESIDYGKEWLERFQTVVLLAKIVIISIGSLLCLGLFFIISNTIRLSLYSNSKEIEIMKLVGATNWYIKVPYIVEGALEGMSGSTLSLLLLAIVFKLFLLKINALSLSSVFLPSIVFIPPYTMGGILLSGTVIGCLGSFLTVHRFLQNYN